MQIGPSGSERPLKRRRIEGDEALKIPSLPEEVLLYIFSFLQTHKDLVNVSLVSLSWKAISDDNGLWKDMFFRHFYRHPFSSENHKAKFISVYKEEEKKIEGMYPWWIKQAFRNVRAILELPFLYSYSTEQSDVEALTLQVTHSVTRIMFLDTLSQGLLIRYRNRDDTPFRIYHCLLHKFIWEKLWSFTPLHHPDAFGNILPLLAPRKTPSQEYNIVPRPLLEDYFKRFINGAPCGHLVMGKQIREVFQWESKKLKAPYVSVQSQINVVHLV